MKEASEYVIGGTVMSGKSVRMKVDRQSDRGEESEEHDA